MDKDIFFSTLLVLASFTLPMILWPETSQVFLNELEVIMEDNFGSIYQLLSIAVLIFVLWVAFSK